MAGLRKEIGKNIFLIYIKYFYPLHVWNDRPLLFNKKLWGKTLFKMPKFKLELFKTLILNDAYIHSKHWKLGMFTLFQKYQFLKGKYLQYLLARDIVN